LATEPFVLSQIYDAHATPAEELPDAVLTEKLTNTRVGGDALRETCHRSNLTPLREPGNTRPM
jgi:hypothetical protein